MAGYGSRAQGPETLPLGSLVAGRYRLDRLLGTGGFGAVYAATAQDRGHRVALKVLDNRVIDKLGGDARFAREAELARRLDHPHVVRVLDEGRSPDGTRYIAFELLAGRSVEDEIQRWGPMQTGQALRITLEVLAALEAAHGIGIIHRDLKPANVFLLEGDDRVKLLDFGIAKSTNPNTLAGLTQDGTMLGTPMYMGPELMTGGEIGPATDLFAVGLLLLEMLLGGSPYPPDITAIQLVGQRLKGEPVPIPEVIRRSPLGRVVAHATQLEPSARYARAQGMADDLRQARQDPTFRDAIIAPAADWTSSSAPSMAFQDTFHTPAHPSQSLSRSHPPPGAFHPGPLGAAPPGHAHSAATPAYAAYGQSSPPAPWPGHHASASPAQQGGTPPAHGWGPPMPTPGRAPVAPARASGASPWLAIVAALGALVVMGMGAGLWIVGRGVPPPPERTDGPQRDGIPDRQPVVKPAPPPVTRPAPAPPPSLGELRAQPCRGASLLTRPALRRHLRATGWNVAGTLTLCAGNMINFRCDSGQGKGWTATRGGERAQAAVLRFPSRQAASSWVQEQSARLGGDLTLAGPDGRALLYLQMPASDAEALTRRVCR